MSGLFGATSFDPELGVPFARYTARRIRGALLDELRSADCATPDLHQSVVLGCFFEDRPMCELAEELGVTESRISQLRAEALKMLRDGMNAS